MTCTLICKTSEWLNLQCSIAQADGDSLLMTVNRWLADKSADRGFGRQSLVSLDRRSVDVSVSSMLTVCLAHPPIAPASPPLLLILIIFHRITISDRWGLTLLVRLWFSLHSPSLCMTDCLRVPPTRTYSGPEMINQILASSHLVCWLVIFSWWTAAGLRTEAVMCKHYIRICASGSFSVTYFI